jgi:DNA-binding MarR family transcriptional regulator
LHKPPRRNKRRSIALPSASSTKAPLPAAALLSFLKETRGATTWTGHDFAKTLGLTRGAAKQAIAILEMQGYVKPSGLPSGSTDEWITTPQGETVSDSKFPRYSRATLERSLDSFADHLKRVNEDPSAPYKVADAVAFGDFLADRARVQAADIGIRLVPRDTAVAPKSAGEQARQAAFLKQLRGRTPLVNLLPYADWMRTRTHRNLLTRGR